jgi:hypothetical protein
MERDGRFPDTDNFDGEDEDIPLRPDHSVVRRGPGRPRNVDMLGTPDTIPPRRPLFSDEPKETKEEPMSKKNDLAAMVGKDMMDAQRKAMQAQVAAQFDANTSPLSNVANAISARTIGDLATQFPSVTMRIKRRNTFTQRWDIVPAPKGVDPKTIVEPGALEDLILNWSGGGEYEIELAAPGTKGTVPIAFTLDAPPQPTPQFRASPNGFISQQQQNDTIGRFLSPQQAGQAAAAQQQAQEQSGLMKLVEQMLAAQMMQGITGGAQQQGSNREVEELKRQTQELQAQLRASEERARADRERSEMMQKFTELSAKIDQQAQAKPSPLESMLPALLPVVTAILGKGDTAAATMATMMQAVMGQQQQSATTTMELFKAMNSKPEVEERFAALVGTMGNMSANTMAMMTQVMQSGLLDKGGDSPFTQILSQVIGEAADVAKVVFQNMGGGGQQEEAEDQTQQAMPSLPPARMPDAQLTGLQSQPLPSYAPQPAMVEEQFEEQFEEQEEDEEEDEEDEPANEAEAEKANDNTYDLMRDAAFREILERIAGGGGTKDIAVRLYKHGNVAEPTKGHPVAKAWFTDPQRAGRGIMEQLGVAPARAEEVLTAVLELTAHLAAGKELGEYLPGTRAKREVKRIAATQATSAVIGEHYDPNTITRVATNPPPPIAPTEQPTVIEVEPEDGPVLGEEVEEE